MADEGNPTVGYCDCAYCGEVALVKKNRIGKLYVNCTDHPVQHLNTKSGQDWILNNMRETREKPPDPLDDPPEPVIDDPPVVDPPAPAPSPAPRPTPRAAPKRAAPKPAPKRKRGFLSDIEDW